MTDPTISTASEDVEWLALSLAIADQPITAATLRALRDERDAAQVDVALLRKALNVAATRGCSYCADDIRIARAALAQKEPGHE